MHWNLHLTHVVNKVSKCIGILYKLKNVLPKSALVLLYNTFMLPYLNYCITVWGNYNKSNITVIHRLQKKALRICTGSHYRAHSPPIFQNLKTLNILDLYSYNVALLGFYYFKDMLPHNISIMFCTNNRVHNYNTRNNDNFHLWAVKSNFMKNSLRHQFPLIWNTLPENIRSCNTLSLFKRSLKKHYLAKYT